MLNKNILIKKNSTHSINSSNANALNGLAAYLLKEALLEKEIIKSAIIAAEKQNISLTNYLVNNKIILEEKILACYKKYFDMPIYDLSNYNFSYLQNSLIKPELMCRYRVLPLYHDEYRIQLGLTDPTNHEVISAISFHTGLQVHPMLISEIEFDKILTMYLRNKRLDNQLESTLLKISPIEEISTQYNDTEEDDGPVSDYVNRLICDAIEQHISDIHIEPSENNCRIRFRRDGLLYQAAVIPSHLSARIITRLKLLSQLNIAERRLPQDGRLQLPEISTIDIRINTCPTLYGEKVVLRILNASNVKLEIDALGFTEKQKQIFISKLHQPQGLILVTGPTGSGKTVTLYSALNYLNKIEKNISSVEDPVEIEVSGINQININSRIGLDFAMMLRTLLRQDPDIIMVGEIRDAQTAAIAVQASQTGHLVLSTLHTNSAVDTITRLQSMDISPYHFIDSVSLIIAQRLVRKLCDLCKQKNEIISLHLSSTLKNTTTYQAKGCEHCYQGYQGRIGIFELLPMTDALADLIIKKSSASLIYEMLEKQKLMSLYKSGMEKVKSGLTSFSEVIRIVGNSSPNFKRDVL